MGDGEHRSWQLHDSFGISQAGWNTISASRISSTLASRIEVEFPTVDQREVITLIGARQIFRPE